MSIFTQTNYPALTESFAAACMEADRARAAERKHKQHDDANGARAEATVASSSRQTEGNSSPKFRPTWEIPDWSLLDDRRGELPDFPISTLPEPCQEWVERAARGAGVTPAHVAAPLLGIASSLIGTARCVQASRSWTQPTTTWVGVVGFSGTGKTPGIDATKRALAQIERHRKNKIATLELAHDTRVEAANAAREKWKKEVEAAIEAGKPEPQKPAAAVTPGAFVAPRLFVSDGTIERLAVLIQVRPQGILYLSDEVAGLFMNMSRYSGGQDNEFWLEAWNGNPHTVERMGRRLALEHLLIGIVGGMQPDKLAKCFEGAADGMYARFCFSWPIEPAYQPLANDVAEVEPEIFNALTRLVDLAAGQDNDGGFAPRAVPLSADAREQFEQFRQFVHVGKHGLDGREREWWAKMPAHALRLAGTLALLDWAWVGGQEPAEIAAVFMQAAVQLVRDYFWPHSRAALRQIGLCERHVTARRVLRWIAAHKKISISLRDVRRDALSQSLDAEQTATLLDGLTKAGWLRREVEKPSGPSGGRPIYRWAINPQLQLWAATTAGTAETL